MATFVSRYSRLNFFDMQFVNGRYETNDPKQIRILSSREAKANCVMRIDTPPKAVKEEAKEEQVEAKEAVESSNKSKQRSADGKFTKKK